MSTPFNLETWKDKAYSRFKKAKASSRGKGSKANSVAVAQRLKRDLTYIEKIRHVAEWCDLKSIDLEFGHNCGSMYELIGKGKIQINTKHTPEKQLYTLLHECGHHLIGNKKKHERYGMGYSNSDVTIKRSLLYRIDVLDEELEAWHRGTKLANRLGITIDKKEYNKFRVSCIKTYIEWSIKTDVASDFSTYEN